MSDIEPQGRRRLARQGGIHLHRAIAVLDGTMPAVDPGARIERMETARAGDHADLRRRPAEFGEPSGIATERSEEHTSELQSLMRISYAVFCLKKKNIHTKKINNTRKKTKRTTD